MKRHASLYVSLIIIGLLVWATPASIGGSTSAQQDQWAALEDTGPKSAVLLFFYTPGCDDCDRVENILEKFQSSDPHLHVIELNILKTETAALNKGICMELELPPQKHGVAPSIFGDAKALVNTEIDPHALLNLIEASRGKTPFWADASMLKDRGKSAIGESYEELTIFMVLGAGLADGVNPCAFAVIIFFLTYMTYVGKSRKEIVIAGILYTVAVFLTYLTIGVGLLQIVSSETLSNSWFRRIAYLILIGLLVVATILSFRDALSCSRGETDKIKLKLPEAIKRRIRLYITRRTRHGLTVFGSLSLGVIVALLEFPCTGQIYVPIITYLSVQPLSAFGWLVLYNLCFVLPLVIIFLCVLGGTSSDQIKAIFQRHLVKTKIAMGCVFLLMATILIFTFP